MNRTAKITLVVIGIMSILVGFGMHSYLTEARTTIYLFADSFSAGTQITPDMFVSDEIETRIVTRQLQMRGENDPRFITAYNIDAVIGTYLRTDVVVGTVLLSSHSMEIGGSPVEIALTPGYVAVTIPAINIDVGNPLLSYGSRVNIYTSFSLENQQAITAMFAQYVRVLDIQVSQPLDTEIGAPILSGIIVEVSAEQSLDLMHAIENGKVRLGVVRAGAYEIIDIPPVESVVSEPMNEQPLH